MNHYYTINVQGKWVECKKALPKFDFSFMNKRQDHYSFQKFVPKIETSEDCDQTESVLQQKTPFSEQQVNIIRDSDTSNFPPVFKNITPIEVIDDPSSLEGNYKYFNSVENKENVNYTSIKSSEIKENSRMDENYLIDPEKVKPKDPRKFKLIELNNKSSSRFITQKST